MRSWICIKFTNFGQNIQILFENREKMENICSIYMWEENGVKLCTGVLHNLTKYINYYVWLNMSQIRLLGQNIQISCKNRRNGKHCRIHISVKFCTVLVHKFSKDIIYDIKLNRSKISKWDKTIILWMKCKKLENICSILFYALV